MAGKAKAKKISLDDGDEHFSVCRLFASCLLPPPCQYISQTAIRLPAPQLEQCFGRGAFEGGGGQREAEDPVVAETHRGMRTQALLLGHCSLSPQPFQVLNSEKGLGQCPCCVKRAKLTIFSDVTLICISDRLPFV